MKISVVIPTRDRADTLKYSLRTAMAAEDSELEIVVSDNASRDETSKIVESFEDPRIRYVNTGARVSMRENFNHAFKESTGEYVLFFGDDDGLLPRQLKFLRRLLEEYRPDGVSWPRPTYGWPENDREIKTRGVRVYRDKVFGTPRWFNTKDRLPDLLSCRISRLSPSPYIYHGCVSRAYVRSISVDPDAPFDSAIPDINFEYHSIISGGSFIDSGHPFSINGFSQASTGGAHGNFSHDDPRGKPGRDFVNENRSDPLKDVVEHELTVPMAFFSTLETVRKRIEHSEPRPDYSAWYRYVMSAARKDADLGLRLRHILTDYAGRTGTTAELEQALQLKSQPKRSLVERLTRVFLQVRSVKVSAEDGGENNVQTAASTFDHILGDEYGEILDRTCTRAAAWRLARARAKVF